jgi:hypothetical protein
MNIIISSQPGATSEVHLQRPTSPVTVPEFPVDDTSGKLQRSIDSVMSSSDPGANEMIAGKKNPNPSNPYFPTQTPGAPKAA